MTVSALNESAHFIMPLVWRASWQGAIALVAVLLITRLFVRVPASIHCWLWRLAFLKLLVAAPLVWSIEVPVLPLPGPLPSSEAANAWRPVPASDELAAVKGDVDRGVLATSNGGDVVASGHSKGSGAATFPTASSENRIDSLGWLMIVWLIGVTVCGVKLVAQWFRVRTVVARSTAATDEELHLILQRCCRQFGWQHLPQLRFSEDVTSPCLVGILRPVILLPVRLRQGATINSVSAALQHEVAHIRRRDLLWNWLPAVAEILFFFHPLVWLVRREWRTAQEIATDALALSASRGDAADYARMLMEMVVDSRSSTRPHLALGVSEAYSQLSRRLMALTAIQNPGRVASVVSQALVAIAVCGIIPWKLTGRPARGQADPVVVAGDSAFETPGTSDFGPPGEKGEGIGPVNELTNPPRDSESKPAPQPEALNRPKTYQQLIAERPVPNLATLAQRSAPEDISPDSTESFWDILKLRETPDPQSLPVLEKILVVNLPTRRIHGFAAAQALFTLGTADAGKILDRHFLSSGIDAKLAMKYTSHWEMREPLRSQFIEKYLLMNLASDLGLEVRQGPQPAAQAGEFKLIVTIRNASERTFHLADPASLDLLIVRDQTGRVIPDGSALRMHKPPVPQLLELKPGMTHDSVVTLIVQSEPAKDGKLLSLQARESGQQFEVGSERVEIVAMLEAQPLHPQQRKFMKVDDDWPWWTGRAVSKALPLDLTLPPVP